MDYRSLGNTDIKVSTLCLGSMTWGRQNTEEEGHAQIDYALSQGINFIDTAEMYSIPPSPDTYGKTEEIIGSYFQKSRNRNTIILATKIAGDGIRWIRGGSAQIDSSNIKLAVEASLKRLQTDYIDLYQLHWPNRGSYHFGQLWNYQPGTSSTEKELENFESVLKTLQELIKEGKIRHIGLSNETAWGTMQYLRLAQEKGLPRMVTIQNEYNLLYRLHEPDLAEISLREKIGLLAWSPLATGMLTGKYLGGKIPAQSRWSILKKHNQRNTENAHSAVSEYIKLAKTHSLDPAQMALAYILTKPFLTSAIIGATSLEQLKVNISSGDIQLSNEVIHSIELIRKKYPIPY